MLADVEVAITRSSTDVDVNFLNHAKKLKALIRAGVGWIMLISLNVPNAVL